MLEMKGQIDQFDGGFKVDGGKRWLDLMILLKFAMIIWLSEGKTDLLSLMQFSLCVTNVSVAYRCQFGVKVLTGFTLSTCLHEFVRMNFTAGSIALYFVRSSFPNHC